MKLGIAVFFVLVLAVVVGYLTPTNAQRIANDPALSAICNPSDTSGKNDQPLPSVCTEQHPKVFFLHALRRSLRRG